MTEYTLYYWPIPFRGHFIRYILAHVGARWEEPSFDTVVAAKNAPVSQQPYPFLAPPMIHDHATGKRLSQMPAIAMYLGRKHKLIGDPDESLRLLCDASDILLEITRSHGAQMWDRAAWDDFTETRLPRWMRLHERVASQIKLSATTPNLCCLTLAALWHTMIDKLPRLRPLLHANAPGVEALTDKIAARAEIAAMLETWQGDGPRYCGGQIEASLLEMLQDAEGG